MSNDKKPEGGARKDIPEEVAARVRAQIGYSVGYGKPPEHTRFQKGQRANPHGRPRVRTAEGLSLKDQPLLNAVHEQAASLVKVREGDGVAEITTRAASLLALRKSALSGNARSLGLQFDLFRAADILYARDRADRLRTAVRKSTTVAAG